MRHRLNERTRYSLAIHFRQRIFGAMRSAFLTGMAVIAASLAATAAHADSMRCGNRLVRDGDPTSSVLAFCGEPSDVQRRTVLRRPYYDVRGRLVYFGDGLEEILVETWTYNFGPHKLMRRVRFVDGVVDEVETLGYGYNDPKRGTYDAGG